MAPSNLLDLLRSVSHVDCDTMDVDVANELGPFVDCTSNQAIAYLELSKKIPDSDELYHKDLIKEAIRVSQNVFEHNPQGTTLVEYVVDMMMVALQLQFAKQTTGFLLVQVNPYYAYQTEEIVEQSRRIVKIASLLDPTFDTQRLCVKIPATWEGLEAAGQLESGGITTLATIVFGMAQAAKAAHHKCTYIAPYVNELKVHFEPGYESESKLFDFCREAQAYYVERKKRTQVMAASLTSIDECMQLAGIQHITISPPLLRGLARFDTQSYTGELGAFFNAPIHDKSWERYDFDDLSKDQKAWQDHTLKEKSGTGRKLPESIKIFEGFQTKLEELVRQHMQ